jgi:hypothetical protein
MPDRFLQGSNNPMHREPSYLGLTLLWDVWHDFPYMGSLNFNKCYIFSIVLVDLADSKFGNHTLVSTILSASSACAGTHLECELLALVMSFVPFYRLACLGLQAPAGPPGERHCNTFDKRSRAS